MRGTRYSIGRLVLAATLLASGLATTAVAPAARADTAAVLDDSSVASPTGWWTYTNVSASTVTSNLSANGARLTDIEIYSTTGPKFTVTMVQNSGAYAAPGWWWYYGLTFSQVGDRLSTNSARLVDIEPYRINDTTRYAVIMVANTGSFARGWSYLSGVSASAIADHIAKTGHRIIDLDTYVVGDVRKYAMVAVTNSGTNAHAWQWWLNQGAAAVNTRLKDFNGRLVDIERLPDGRFNIVMVKNSGAEARSWWYYTGLTSAAQVVDVANQLGGRLIDIETYSTSSGRRYLAVIINNSNAETSRIRGIFDDRFIGSNGLPLGSWGAYLKQVGTSPGISLNASDSVEFASSTKVVHLLHTMQSVQAGEGLSSAFTYWNYPNSLFNAGTKDACPIASDETDANDVSSTLEFGADKMMSISDNRTTRGIYLRYGGAAINTTAANAGLTNTFVNGDLGCGYYYSSGSRTSLVDLGKVYEGAHSATLLSGTARDEFWESVNTGNVADESPLDTVIEQEAAKQGKSGIVNTFRVAVIFDTKGGSYDTCKFNAAKDCIQRYIIRSEAGRVQLPIKLRDGSTSYRPYVFGRFINNIPVPAFSSTETTNFTKTYDAVRPELFRAAIRSALQTW